LSPPDATRQFGLRDSIAKNCHYAEENPHAGESTSGGAALVEQEFWVDVVLGEVTLYHVRWLQGLVG
jgi:hypothetical protein